MPISSLQSAAIIVIVSAVTILIRFSPFLIFQKKTPALVLYLGQVLPYSIIAMLVVYCLKGVNLLSGNHGIPDILAVVFVAVLHKWRHSTLLSILGGTIFYMVLIQFVF